MDDILSLFLIESNTITNTDIESGLEKCIHLTKKIQLLQEQISKELMIISYLSRSTQTKYVQTIQDHKEKNRN